MFVTSGLLSGCSAFEMGIKGDYTFEQESNKGLVAISTHLVDTCGHIDSFNANIYEVEGGAFPTALPVKTIWKSDFPDNGYFYVLELNGGSYTIGNIFAAGMGLLNTDEKNMASFSVDAGDVIYVGEVEFTVNADCTEVYTAINDRWVRDSLLFKERVTNIAIDEVVQKLATTK